MQEENENKESNLPISQNEKRISESVKKNTGKVIDFAKRTGKVLGLGVAGVFGLGTASILTGAATMLSVPAGVAIGAVSIYSTVRGLSNIIYKVSPDLMFVEQKIGNNIAIFQDTRIGLSRKMKGYDSYEMGAMMGLQTIVGFARDKENLAGSKMTIEEDGTKCYKPSYSTVTHGINLKNIELLQTLGYIKIDQLDEELNSNQVQDLLHIKPKRRQTLLIPEKLGFKNYKALVEIKDAILSGDKEKIERQKVDLKKVHFRLTDKPIDFEELYMNVNNLSQIENPEQRKAYKRLSAIFSAKHGLLSKKDNLGIKKDAFGRTILSYNENESFVDKMERKTGISFKKRKENKTVEKLFDEKLKEGVPSIDIKLKEENDIEIKSQSKEALKTKSQDDGGRIIE